MHGVTVDPEARTARVAGGDRLGNLDAASREIRLGNNARGRSEISI
jgi:hypothetical protein